MWTGKRNKKRFVDGVTNTEYLLLRKLLKDHLGKENAIPGDELARYLGLASTRDVRLLVEKMRHDHEPIMSLPGVGYWSPKEWGEEESHCIRSLRDMGKKFFWDAECVEKGLLDLYGDPKMF